MTYYKKAAFGFAIAGIVLGVLMLIFGYVGMKYETCKSAYQSTLQSETTLARSYQALAEGDKVTSIVLANQAQAELKAAKTCE